MKIRISLPLQLIFVIAFVLLFGKFFSFDAVRLAYTFSIVFKEILTFMLPFIVFSFVLTGILALEKNAPYVLLVMLGLIFLSNGLVALMVYGVMNWLLPVVSCNIKAFSLDISEEVLPYFSFQLPKLIKSEHALLASIIAGITFSFIRVPVIEEYIVKFKTCIEWFLYKILIPLLPVYVFGFLLKMRYEGAFVKLFQNYGTTFLLIVAIQVCYLFFMYLVASGFSIKKTFIAINNALPSYLTAFTTMSSAATIPVSVDCAEKNTGNRSLSMVAMPIMANVHLLGDSIGTPILAMVTMYLFQGCLPSLWTYIGFVFYFCTTMFAVSGVPGGTIIVMIPILVAQLGFTNEMVSVITTLYLLMDSFGTAANVMGDGALVIILNKTLNKLRIG